MRFARTAFVALLALLLAACPGVANAKFSTSVSAALPVSSGTLAAPTNVSVKCQGSAQRATITWTATADTYATGYVVYESYGGSESSQAVSGQATTSSSPSSAVPAGTIVTLVSVFRSWTSARSVSATAPSSCH